MSDATAIRERAREGEKDEIAAGNESRREAVLADLDGDLARKRGLGEGGERVEAHHMILAKAGGPRRSQRQHVLAHALTCLELGTMALLVVEADRLHASEALERPGQTDGRVLSSGEQD